MGKYNSIYGYNIETPNFLNLAKESTVFRKAFCACPTCSPSRGALLTGMHPQTNGLIGLAHRGFSLNNIENHLSFYLKKFGIQTVLCGEQHEVQNRQELGYEKLSFAPRQKDTDIDTYTAQCAAEYLKNAHEPFFLSVGFVSPHRPYKTHTDIDPDYITLPNCLPDNEETRKDFADYMTSVSHADDCAGVVLAALKESGLYDKTVIILTTDHGIAFPYMKCHLYDTGIGVTLAIKTIEERKIKLSDTMVSHLDIFPTICDLLNIPYPEWLQGVSLNPILKGEKDKVREYVFSGITYHAAYEPVRCIRTDRYKYIRRFDNDYHKKVLPNLDDGYSKRFLLKNGIADVILPEEELYDLYLDPCERNNLCISQPKENEATIIRNELSEKLFAWMKEINDPLLKGKVPKPKGAIVNKQTCINPDDDCFEE